jgi:hypothetical protein
MIVKGTAKEMKDSLAHLPELEWDELEQLAPCVKKLHEVTERICKAKIQSFTAKYLTDSIIIPS